MKITLQGQDTESKIFYNNNLYESLSASQKDGYKPLFMPQIVDARINANAKSEIWQWYCAPSVKATGRTKQGNAVVVYAHIDNYFSNPQNIIYAISRGLVNGAGLMPQKQFQELVDKDELKDERGNRLVWAVDHKVIISSSSGVISVSNALEHPQTIPFLGGEEQTQKYLQRHKDICGEIGVYHCDDLRDEPLGRLLLMGDYCGDGLGGGSDLDYCGRFVGVRCAEGAARSAQKIKQAPTLDEILNLSLDFVPHVAMDVFKKKLSKLYNK